MLNISVISHSFDASLSESYNLSIQINLDGLCFSIFDPIANTFLYLKSIDFQGSDEHYAKHEEAMLTVPMLLLKYKSVSVMFDAANYVLMPASLYQESENENILTFCGAESSNDYSITAYAMKLTDIVTVYGVPQFLYYFLRSQYDNVKILHHTTPIIESIVLKRPKEKKDNRMIVYFHDKKITIAVGVKQVLQLCNTFVYNDLNDMLYVVLFIIDQLGLNYRQTDIEVSGDIAADDIRFLTLRKHINTLRLAERPSYFNYDFGRVAEQHRYSNLFNMMLCE